LGFSPKKTGFKRFSSKSIDLFDVMGKVYQADFHDHFVLTSEDKPSVTLVVLFA
jgi:hypothetical protein